MEIWSILIYPLGLVLGGFAGILLTALIYYLICRFVTKESIDLSSTLRLIIHTRLIIILSPVLIAFSRKKYQLSLKKEIQSLKAMAVRQPEVLARQIEEKIPIQTIKEPPLKPAVYNKDLEVIITKLLGEFEYNFNKARRFSGGKLVSLETKAWDTGQPLFNSFPGKLQKELKDVYESIKILNNLVWFATEFQRRSPAINEQYTNLLNAIADKLNELIRNPILGTFHERLDYQAVVVPTPVIAATPYLEKAL